VQKDGKLLFIVLILEESVQEINNTLKMSVFAFIGFLATLLITLATGVFPIN